MQLLVVLSLEFVAAADVSDTDATETGDADDDDDDDRENDEPISDAPNKEPIDGMHC